MDVRKRKICKRMDKGRRDGSLPIKAQRELYQRAACMCEFEGCSVPLFYDLVSASPVNNGQFAHIIPSSVNGPRGDFDSGTCDVGSPENRILLCKKHHELVDDDPSKYPPVVLRRMKASHESKVAAFVVCMRQDAVFALIFSSKIKGIHEGLISDAQINEAAVSSGHPLLNERPYRLCINTDYKYATRRYWQKQVHELEKHIARLRDDIKIRGVAAVRLAVFPIAPIPLIIKLGSLLIDSLQLKVYPKLRSPECWCWQKEESFLSFHFKKLKDGEGVVRHVGLVISISDDIGRNVLDTLSGDVRPMYHMKAKNIRLDAIRTEKDLSIFDKSLYSLIGRIQKKFGQDVEIDIFPAIPNTAAFEIGYRHMPKVHPKLNIYENSNGWKFALSIER